VFTRHARERWTLRPPSTAKPGCSQVAAEPAGLAVEADVVAQACPAAPARHRPGRRRPPAARADERIGLLVGPAGAGKTRTLRAVVDAWQHDGGNVIGLTVSQAAAEVLATEAQVRAENTAKWLYETRHGRWQLPDRPLLLIDEASMVSTGDLVTLVAQARQAGGKVLLVGDPAQLSAIHIGGAFDLLAERHGAAHLTEIRRFTHPWEADASVLLRDRDPAAIDAYAMRGRIHGGRLDELETALFDAWKADALGTDDHGQRETVAMIVATNDQAAVLGRTRPPRPHPGRARPGRPDRAAGRQPRVGRRPHRHPPQRPPAHRHRTAAWVVNGQTWTITAVHDNGDAEVARHGDGATLRLPADYLAATRTSPTRPPPTVPKGMTVDRAHATVDADTTHQQLYVAATRGRHANDLWVALDSDRDLIADDTHLPDPQQLLARALARQDPDRLSAHQLADDSHTSCTRSPGSAPSSKTPPARPPTGGSPPSSPPRPRHAVRDGEWGSLLDRTRQLALQGHDLDQLLDRAITMRPIDDAHSVAGVLHWRLGQLADHTEPARRPGPLRSLPPSTATTTPRTRPGSRRADPPTLATAPHPARRPRPDRCPTPRALGPRPDDPADARTWLTAATAVTAYRERYDLPDHLQLLGERPGPLRPDAQAAYDHAQLQVDRTSPASEHDVPGPARRYPNGAHVDVAPLIEGRLTAYHPKIDLVHVPSERTRFLPDVELVVYFERVGLPHMAPEVG
jgi:hypothetical protein